MLLGRISKKDFWVLEISCILTSSLNFVARTHPMLQKLTLPLSKECVLVLHTLPQHPVFVSSLVALLMSGYHCPPTTAQHWYELHFHCCWPCWTASNTAFALQPSLTVAAATATTATEKHPKYWTNCGQYDASVTWVLIAARLCVVIEAFALLLTLLCANFIAANSALRCSVFDRY